MMAGPLAPPFALGRVPPAAGWISSVEGEARTPINAPRALPPTTPLTPRRKREPVIAPILLPSIPLNKALGIFAAYNGTGLPRVRKEIVMSAKIKQPHAVIPPITKPAHRSARCVGTVGPGQRRIAHRYSLTPAAKPATAAVMINSSFIETRSLTLAMIIVAATKRAYPAEPVAF